MGEISLDRVLAFNKELAALSVAGVPLQIGENSETVNEVLERADESLALRTSLGQSVKDALEDNEQLPPVYRHAIQSGLLSESPATVLDSISRRTMAQDDLRSAVGCSFVQPLVVLTLAYLGIIFLCLYFSPMLEGIYDQLRRVPSTSVSMLRSARVWMPIWAPLAPVLVIAIIILWQRSRVRSWRWIPFAGRYTTTLIHANYADQIRVLLERGIGLPESLRLASGVIGNPALIKASTALAEAAERGDSLASDDHRLLTLPPLLRWAFTCDLGDQPLPEILNFTAETYSQSAQRQAAIYRIVLPMLIGALLGGVVVFAYALCVFGPYIQLLQDLSV